MICTTCRVAALENYLSFDCVQDTKEGSLDVLQWWKDRRNSEPQLLKIVSSTLALAKYFEGALTRLDSSRTP